MRWVLHDFLSLCRAKYLVNNEVFEYRLIKVNYESKVAWNVCTDYLRCSPSFFGKPRNDCVLLRTVEKLIFACLAFIFVIQIHGVFCPIVLVEPFDLYLGPTRRKDKELGLFRLGIKESSEFMPLQSILRGSLIVKDFDTNRDGEFIVVDVIDGDMFLRIKGMKGEFQSLLGTLIFFSYC